jgi:hypothetical protein
MIFSHDAEMMYTNSVDQKEFNRQVRQDRQGESSFFSALLGVLGVLGGLICWVL